MRGRHCHKPLSVTADEQKRDDGGENHHAVSNRDPEDRLVPCMVWLAIPGHQRVLSTSCTRGKMRMSTLQSGRSDVCADMARPVFGSTFRFRCSSSATKKT